MPFVDLSTDADRRGGAADALAYDVTSRLAKLRSMFVIAQGTTFALRDRSIGPEEAGRMLNVDYVVGGSVRRNGKRLNVGAELIETRTARIIWADVFDEKVDGTLTCSTRWATASSPRWRTRSRWPSAIAPS